MSPRAQVREEGRMATVERWVGGSIRSFAIGLGGVVVFLIVAFLIFTKHVPFTSGYQIKAVFASSNQLIKGSPVRIAGVDVGKVVRFERGPGTTRIVVMEIKDSGQPIHSDATARVRPRLFLEGGFFVALSPGSPSAPTLKDGAKLPLGQTALPVQFNTILGAFDHPTRNSLRNVIKETATALEGGGAQAIGKTSINLAPALKDTALISAAARGQSLHDLSAVIGSGSRIAGTLAARAPQLADLVTNLNITSQALASQDTALAASLRALDGVMREAPSALTALDGALPPLGRLSGELRPSIRLAPPIVDNTLAAIVQLNGIVSPNELPELIDRLRPTLVRLPAVEERLRTLFPLVTPVAQCVSARVAPVLNSKLSDGALSTNLPVWKEFGSSLVGLSSASQNFDGNGPSIRYQAAAGTTSIATGAIPGIGSLVGGAQSPIIGANPRWLGNGVAPPLRPDAKCIDQPAPDLTARSGGRIVSRSGPPIVKPRRVTSKALADAIAALGKLPSGAPR